MQLTAPATFLLDGQGLLDGQPADVPAAGRGPEMPKWIAANTTNELDQRAAPSVSQALPADRSASVSLMELTEDRRTEVRYLAVRCLGYMGQFDPLTAALNEQGYRPYWQYYFDELREAVARGPETAQAIRQSLEKQFATDAPALYRMLWGYTDKDLQGGEDAQLVKDLENENLIFRVLAFLNLKEITGKGHFYYPDHQAAKRVQAVQDWKKDLRLGQIRWTLAASKPQTPPVVAPPRPAAPPIVPPRSNPGDADLPDDIKPASAIEPIDAPIDPNRSATAAPSARGPKLVYPEPAP